MKGIISHLNKALTLGDHVQKQCIVDKDQQILNFLKKAGQFSEAELENFFSNRKNINVKKGDTIVKEGQLCHFIYFIHYGVISLFLLKDGEEHIKDFSLSGKFITAYTSMSTGQPSQIFLRAEQDCALSVWDASYFQELILHNHKWALFAFRIAEYLFYRKEKREISMLLHTAEERYQEMLKEFPLLVQQVPQYLLASYLGIKPQSLSRIRNIIAHRMKLT
jgi:CRP-like cAMP-binding protein